MPLPPHSQESRRKGMQRLSKLGKIYVITETPELYHVAYLERGKAKYATINKNYLIRYGPAVLANIHGPSHSDFWKQSAITDKIYGLLRTLYDKKKLKLPVLDLNKLTYRN